VPAPETRAGRQPPGRPAPNTPPTRQGDDALAHDGTATHERESAPVTAWARAIITRGRTVGDVPSYGSHDWCALPAADPRRIAALVVAAESWRADEPGRWWARVQREAEQLGVRRAYLAGIDERWPEVQAAAVEIRAWHLRLQRSRAAGGDYGLTREERVALAALPRPGDYPGGPVAWEPAPWLVAS
jgi:hypothetical protein